MTAAERNAILQAKRRAAQQAQALRKQKVARAKEMTRPGMWRFSRGIAPQGSSQMLSLSLPPVSADYPKSKTTRPPYIRVRCVGPELDIAIVYDEFLGARQKELLMQFDSDKAVNLRWPIERDGKTLIAPDPKDFGERLLLAQRLMVQTTPHREPAKKAVFNLKGLYHASFPFRDACGFGELE